MIQIPGYVLGEPQHEYTSRTPLLHDPCDSDDYLTMDFERSVNCCLTTEEVLSIIAPVEPEQLCIADQYRGLWEAYWTNWNDIDHRRLIKQVRIEVIGKACPRTNDPGSMIVLFKVIGA